ncbi:transcriptional regulation of mitochondrial recombination-domain-containing protein [Biscogniauxia marginata]|nr:transcriptional regulation of mitochondrial recombination-domain-containing protein [Biscogniauxia marginata]
MSLRISPITAQLGKLSIGISRTSIQIRTKKTAAKAKKQRPEKEDKAPKEQLEPVYPPGHGEKIFIFSHFLNGMTVYSHDPVLKANRALKQLPFNGRKMKPSKLRRDYWRPLAMIQFPEGLGVVGQSVFTRLRECRRLHEVAWDDSILYDVETRRTLKRIERGSVLSDQKANAVADMAAVLGGLGKGNKIWAPEPEEIEEAEEAAALAAAEAEVEAEAEAEEKEEGKKKRKKGKKEAKIVKPLLVSDADKVQVKTEDGEIKSLIKAMVWWADPLDQNHARHWPKNVTHHVFSEAQLEPLGVGGVGPPKPQDGDDEGDDGEADKISQTPLAEIKTEQQLRQKLRQELKQPRQVASF